MTEKAEAAAANQLVPKDPDCVPVKTVNLVHTNILGGSIALTLLTDRIGYMPDGKFCADMIVAARLRLDLEIAKAIRDQLSAKIDLLTKPDGKAD